MSSELTPSDVVPLTGDDPSERNSIFPLTILSPRGKGHSTPPNGVVH